MRTPIICLAMMTVLGQVAILRAAEGGANWAVGPALRQQWAAPVGVVWSGVPFRPAILGLADQNRVAVLIDRRIDPDQKLNCTAQDLPLGEVIGQIAAEREIGCSIAGAFVYLGPAWTAERLRGTLQLRHNDLKRLPSAAAKNLAQTARLRWDDLAQPRQLLAILARDHGLKIEGLEQIPHDLWAAADLPPLPLIDRLGLIAVQYDLTFAFSDDGTVLTLAAIPDDVPAVAEPVVKEPPKARKPKPGSAAGEQRFTVRQTKGQVEALLNQLAAKLGYEVKLDRAAIEAAGIALDQPVTFQVKDATVDELFQAVLDPAGLAHRRKGKVLEVFPGK